MLEAFAVLTKLLRYRRLHINGIVFRLHCTLTVLILMFFFIVNSTKQVIGDPIICDVDKLTVEQKLIQTYCYIRSTYSIVQSDTSSEQLYPGYPGLGTFVSSKNQENLVYHYYYQWVWCVLLLQAICFYFPRWLWKACESDKMSSLVLDLNYFTVKREDREKKIDLVVDYLCQTRGTNNWYATKYFFCEFLALVNVVLQIFLVDLFLCGQFLSLGFDFVLYLFNDSTIYFNPIAKVFPILSKCAFSRYGISGHNEYLDFLCLLSINIMNQKIFLFLWFWYWFLALLTVFVVIYRLVLIYCPPMRYHCYRYRFDFDKTKSYRNRQLVVNRLQLGDWFILYLLGHNIEPIVFNQILDRMCRILLKQRDNSDGNCGFDEEVTEIA